MHEYDVTLKLILQKLTALALRELTGVTVTRWYNVELPEINQTRVDLLGETSDGLLLHIELQSTNDGDMPLRMIEYGLRVFRIYGRFPRQILLYVGEAPLRMDAHLSAATLNYVYEQVDIRNLDGEPLMASDQVSDNVIAVLTRLRNQEDAVRKILTRISELEPAPREVALRQLLILAGLRRLEQFVTEEARKMPIYNDIMDHQVFGPAIRQGLEQGRKEGRQEGKREGEMTMLRRQMEKRFGRLPEWVEERLASRPVNELEEIGVRLMEAHSLEELFR